MKNRRKFESSKMLCTTGNALVFCFPVVEPQALAKAVLARCVGPDH